MMGKVKVRALKAFQTWNAEGVITADVGTELVVVEATARRLIRQGLAKEVKPRKPRKKKDDPPAEVQLVENQE